MGKKGVDSKALVQEGQRFKLDPAKRAELRKPAPKPKKKKKVVKKKKPKKKKKKKTVKKKKKTVKKKPAKKKAKKIQPMRSWSLRPSWKSGTTSKARLDRRLKSTLNKRTKSPRQRLPCAER